MRNSLLGLVLAIALAGCSGGGGGGGVTNPVDNEDWSFPTDTSKVSITAIPPDTTRLGEQFEVKIVVYNVPDLFGAAVSLPYERDRVAVEKVIVGPALGSSDRTLGVGVVDSTRGVVDVASTVRAGSPVSAKATGVLCKLRCRSLRTGRLRFRIEDIQLKTATAANVAVSVRREEGQTYVAP